ncbi:MAG: hypothetical protein LBS16_06110 [Prevotellaceae bacterium]|nr:hypothetical protein [Prevotellaceae bacterium]
MWNQDSDYALSGLSFGSSPNRRALPSAIDFGFSTQSKYLVIRAGAISV